MPLEGVASCSFVLHMHSVYSFLLPMMSPVATRGESVHTGHMCGPKGHDALSSHSLRGR